MPPKRKVQSLGLDRRVRPRHDEKWNLEPESDNEQSNDDRSEEDVGKQDSEDEDLSEAADDEESESESEDEAPPKVDLSAVTFGALARAQASMPATNRRAKKSRKSDPDFDAAEPTLSLREQAEARRRSNQNAGARPGRSSKHAPQEQTSKKPVSRRREILADPRRKARDPRFDSFLGPVDEGKTRRAYAFLDEYRESEMADLRAQIRKAKRPVDRDALKRELLSMESRKKAQKKADEAGALIKEHRTKEKELVAQGKQPFYLKKSAQKTQILTNRFADMSKGEVDRAIERKRKKVAGKERKELDSLVRVRDRA
ncbi:pre-rRNA processing [Cordyceps militaris]|uniref:rRNA biogenesis protein RRP36 n=1 Tax=Cordyceps militaris TaxID=73501 RepID=A0A2H4STP1_CORMI|nr:pre-rRNA processing [Cordyceps militaris]